MIFYRNEQFNKDKTRNKKQNDIKIDLNIHPAAWYTANQWNIKSMSKGNVCCDEI